MTQLGIENWFGGNTEADTEMGENGQEFRLEDWKILHPLRKWAWKETESQGYNFTWASPCIVPTLYKFPKPAFFFAHLSSTAPGSQERVVSPVRGIAWGARLDALPLLPSNNRSPSAFPDHSPACSARG